MATTPVRLEDIPNLQQILESRWSKLHNQPAPDTIFRYQLTIERERVTTDGEFNFLLQLNRKRTTDRRKPEITAGLQPPFDPNRFNFNRANPREVLLEVRIDDTLLTVLVNVSPLSHYHSLLVPDRERNLPQVLTAGSLNAVIRFMLSLEDRDYRIGYNSSGAMASVNHLHFHLVHVCQKLYVEDAPLTKIGSHLYRLDNQPAKAYCFVLEDQSTETGTFITRTTRLISTLLSAEIGHNLFLTWDAARTTLRVLIYPRLRLCENKQVSPFNVAGFELSGFVTLGEESDYERLDGRKLAEYFREAQGTDLYERLDSLVLKGLEGTRKRVNRN
ncbi:GDP-D-glucose phosphorylase 1 [Topomyia yanbarensis]|uniref:GDP-D-glucose phosphorylase 1 n=1 Tax=Topomyia yanbarensis TaxID=2498891 RepID=UPI00273C7EB1|nr:GDP-D-glucose phosphorylase 1 [Topomyia yanbarensis]